MANPGYLFNPLTAVLVPEGIDEARLRKTLLLEHDIEISGGIGDTAGKVIRIGLMSDSCHPSSVLVCLSALEICLAEQGYKVEPGIGLAAAQKAFSLSAM